MTSDKLKVKINVVKGQFRDHRNPVECLKTCSEKIQLKFSLNHFECC